MTMPRAVLSILFITLLSVWSASAQTTEFTYQGSLKDGNAAAGGNYDFQFALFNAASGGTQLGPVVSRTLSVADGIFSVTLDFGAVYDGSARFLEIRVRNSGAANFTTLNPRQPVNSTPHAVKALSAGQLNGVDAGQYVLTNDFRLGDDRNPKSGSLFYIQNSTALQGFAQFYVGTGRATVLDAVDNFSFNGKKLIHTGAVPKYENLYIGFNSGISQNGTLRATFLGYETGRFNDFGNDNSFFGWHAGRGNTAGNNNSIFGSGAGLVSTIGNDNAFYGFNSGSLNTTGSGNTFYGSTAGRGNISGSNNTLIGFGADADLPGLNFATAIGSGAKVGTDNTVILGRNLDTVRVPGVLAVNGTSSFGGNSSITGNLNVTGTLTAGTLSVTAQSITGIIAPANGGTGISSPGAAGNFLRSTGSAWQSASLSAADLPAGNANYIQNGTSSQATSNFNISGNGTVGGTLSAATVNATNQFNLGGSRILTGSGNNLFVGFNAGSANTGTSNTFVGASSGQSNVAGSNNTLLGSGTNVGSGGLNFATAVGAGAAVSSNNTVVLGRSTDAVNVPGTLAVTGNTSVGGNLMVTGTISGSFSVTNVSGVLPAANGGTGIGGVGGTGTFLRSNGTIWQAATLSTTDIPSLGGSYVQNGTSAQSANFNITGNGTIGGGLTVGGALTAASFPAANLTGTIAASNGGTGLTSAGTTGNFLRSTGSGWASQGLSTSDIPNLGTSYIQNGNSVQTGNFNISGNGMIGGNLTVTGSINGNFIVPAGSANYIQNGISTQSSSNFNISGNGTAGGTLSAATVNAVNQFSLGGSRVLSNGNNNLFVGIGAGPSATGSNNTIVGENTGNSTTTGTDNVFVGFRAGFINTTGSMNTVVGTNANLSVNNLTFATAVGANSIATANDTIVIGKTSGTYNGNMRPADSVVIPGTLSVAGDASAANLSTSGMVTVSALGSAGSTALCRNASNQISTCSSSARYKYNINNFGSGLDIVRKLRPVSFNWKADGMADMGLVAEEVAAVEPLLVNRNANGQVEGVKYDRVGVILLNAVKEQQTQIESLQKEVDARKASEADLKDKLSKQQTELDALKKLVCSQNPGAAICQQ